MSVCVRLLSTLADLNVLYLSHLSRHAKVPKQGSCTLPRMHHFALAFHLSPNNIGLLTCNNETCSSTYAPIIHTTRIVEERAHVIVVAECSLQIVSIQPQHISAHSQMQPYSKSPHDTLPPSATHRGHCVGGERTATNDQFY
jgi:hypothetical protein